MCHEPVCWSKYPLQCFFAKILSWGFLDNFLPTGTYTRIGTSVLSLKHVIKSTTKKRKTPHNVKWGYYSCTNTEKFKSIGPFICLLVICLCSFSKQTNKQTKNGFWWPKKEKQKKMVGTLSDLNPFWVDCNLTLLHCWQWTEIINKQKGKDREKEQNKKIYRY